MDAWVAGKRVKLDPARSLGKGGEAEVFEVAGRALKIFKGHDHDDYANQPAEQAAARVRLAEHQHKLRAFPRGLPGQVIAPEELATDKSGATVIGYCMRLVSGALPLSRFSEPSFRRAGSTQAEAAAVLLGLHRALAALHGAQVVIGDFNDLNVLVKDGSALFIDADSFQFGPYPSRVFTERFVDPLLCDPRAAAPALVLPHTRDSDWYAFAALVLQSLLCVGPHGGVHRPKDRSQLVPQPARPLRRVTIFHPEVLYPKPATPLATLPDELLHELEEIFLRDARGPFPRRLLESLEFRACPRCGCESARTACPLCSPHAASRSVTTELRGEVRRTVLHRARGTIVSAAEAGGELRWLVHEGGRYLREDGALVLEGALDPALRFQLCGPETTLVARGEELAVLRPGRAPERLAADAFAAGGRRFCWSSGGRLLRDGDFGPELIGEVLQGRTQLWAGAELGLGLYSAGSLLRAFLFGLHHGGLNDSLPLPRLKGQLIGASAVLSAARAFLRLTTHESGRRVHRALAFGRDGAALGSAEASEGEPDWPWLDALPFGCAPGEALFVPTDEGLCRVEARSGRLLQVRTFPDTEPFLDARCQLLPARGGLHVISNKEIALLQLQ